MRTIELLKAIPPVCQLIGEAAGGESFVIALPGTPRPGAHRATVSEAVEMWDRFDDQYGSFGDEHSTL